MAHLKKAAIRFADLGLVQSVKMGLSEHEPDDGYFPVRSKFEECNAFKYEYFPPPSRDRML